MSRLDSSCCSRVPILASLSAGISLPVSTQTSISPHLYNSVQYITTYFHMLQSHTWTTLQTCAIPVRPIATTSSSTSHDISTLIATARSFTLWSRRSFWSCPQRCISICMITSCSTNPPRTSGMPLSYTNMPDRVASSSGNVFLDNSLLEIHIHLRVHFCNNTRTCYLITSILYSV